MKSLLLAASLPMLCCAQKWAPQESGVTASLRGVHAVDRNIVWASGSAGTWLRTVNGGVKWESGKVTGSEALDIRGIHGFSASHAIAMSSGEGLLSKVFETQDGGAHWTKLFDNPDTKGFFDGLAFSDRLHGALMGDPVNGRFAVFITEDGGKHWTRREGPATNAGEASFAASNSTLLARGSHIWIASGGTGGARIFHSADRGKSWDTRQTPVRHDVQTAGIFSLTWRDAKHGMAVGGDYKNDRERTANIAVTQDGGKNWVAGSGPAGFRSAIEYLNPLKAWITTGTSGSDVSPDGTSWRTFDTAPYNALSGGWAVGPKGAIARLAR